MSENMCCRGKVRGGRRTVGIAFALLISFFVASSKTIFASSFLSAFDTLNIIPSFPFAEPKYGR